MRALFSLIGLLLALLIVAWLVKTQFGAETTVRTTSGNDGMQGQSASQALNQFQQSLNKALKAKPASVPE